MVVYGKMHDASPKLKNQFLRIAIAPVLLLRIRHRLFCEAVLQFERGDRKAIDEDTQIQCELGLVPTVAKLAGHTESVGGEERDGLLVAGRRCAVEKCQVVLLVFQSVAEQVDHAASGDLALQSRKNFRRRRVLVDSSAQLHPSAWQTEMFVVGQNHRIFTVVVLGIAQ